MQFLLSELAAAVGGRLVGDDRTVDGVTTDSRTIEPGQLFVPLVAERDGHDFIPSACEGGAGAYLTANEPPSTGGPGVPAIVVADTAEALTALGRLARSRLTGGVIGITGSVGKTSAKDLTLAACRSAGTVSASAQSFNNEIGVPLTLANAAEDAAIVIVEMGARGKGHIAELCEVARPTIGMVTIVALAHSELFGSLEGVAAAKGELIEALPPEGTAVLNGDDVNVAAMAGKAPGAVLTFGVGEGADVRIGPVTVDRTLRPTFTLTCEGSTAELTLEVRGAHMAANAAAAVAAAVAAGVAFGDAVADLGRASLSRWRMEVVEAPDGLVVINDAYNANPTSVRAALDALAAVDAARRVAVLGIMAELGDESTDEHLAVAAEAEAAGIRVIAIDAPAYGPGVEHVADRDGALAALGPVGDGDAVLVKGSRVAGLEALAATLVSA